MADKTEILYTVRVDTANGKVKIDGITRGFVNADTAARKFGETIDLNSKKLRGNIDKTGLAGATLVELGRTISDSNYGMRAMANNISQLSTLMITLISTTGGAANGFRALWAAFRGPLGLIVVFQAVIAFFEKLAIDEEKATAKTKKLQKGFEGLNNELRGYLSDLNNINSSEEQRSLIIEKIGSKSSELKNIVDQNRDSLKKLTEEIERHIKVKTLSLELEELYREAYVKDAEQRENIRMMNENDIDGMLEKLASASWMPEWYFGWTEKINGGTESIRKKFGEFIAGVGFQEKQDRDKRKEAILEEIRQLGGLGVDEENESQRKLREVLDKWLLKRVESTTTNALELLAIRELIDTKELKNAGATEKQLLDLRIFYSNKRRQLMETEYQSIAELPKFVQDEIKNAKANLEKLVEGGMAVRQLTDEEFKNGQQILFENRLEAASKYAEQAVGILDASFQRELTIEQNKTNAINNELKARLRNENLSVSEKKKLQNQIAQNDEALRVKQQKIEEKRFKMQKAANISQALIETYLAAAKALRNAGGVPTGLPPMYATIATGLLQVAAIAQQKFQTSSANMTGAVTEVDAGQSQGSTAPDFNIVGQSAQSQLAQTVAGQLGKPTKAYIVSKDVTTAQELDRNRINGASLG